VTEIAVKYAIEITEYFNKHKLALAGYQKSGNFFYDNINK